MVKTVKFIVIFIMISIFIFSDFVSFLPESIQKNQLAENFTIKKVQAAMPVFVAAGNQASSINAITPALPLGIAADDILLLFLETANQTITISNFNGGTWTEIVGSPQGTGAAGGANATRLTVFWSRYNGVQGVPTTSDSGNHQIGVIVAVRGVIAVGNPFDVTAGGVEAIADTSGVIPGAITSIADVFVAAAVAGALPDANTISQFSGWANVNLTNISERFDVTRNPGNGGSIGIVTGEKAAAGSYGNTNVTHATSTTKAMISIALKPIPPAPNIISAPLNGQIGSEIVITGNNFGAATGTITINATTAAIIGPWSDTSLTARIPGQEGAANIIGKIQVTRSSDGAISNLYPPDPSNFTILAPSVSGSSPNGAITGQTLLIEFSGAGIDTDIDVSPILKLTKTGETDIIGTAYSKVTDYQAVQATFNLTGATNGYWKLTIINMDGQSGSYGDEITTGFNVVPLAPTITGINPGFGNDFGVTNITSVIGTNFQNGATVKLTKTSEADITPSTAFTFTDSNTLSNGAFDLTGKTAGWWNVVVTNPDLQTGSYGNEIDSGFEIRSSKPLNPANIYQFKDGTDTAQPPITEIAAGEGIGKQTEIYFRMDMEGGLIGEQYYPQVEIKPIGGVFECANLSPSPCAVTTGFFAEGAGVMYNGVAIQGWININGIDGEVYHWQTRVRNSSGASDWVSFGGNSDPNDIDVYLDNTPPTISPGIDGTCGTAAINITDSNAVIRWNTTDVTSGFEPPPGAGSYGTAQAQYIKTSLFADWISTPGNLSTENPRENSPHQIVLSGLSPDTNYTYRMISKDAVANEGKFENCGFLTTASRPIKTVELLIAQETTQNMGTRVSKDFDVYIPESPLGDISIKSAFIEISGISDPALIQTVNVELRRGNGQVFTPAGADYVFSSSGTATPFTILFDALNPPGTGQEDMSNITVGATNYEYTLFLNGTVIPISIFSAKLVITYSYVP